MGEKVIELKTSPAMERIKEGVKQGERRAGGVQVEQQEPMRRRTAKEMHGMNENQRGEKHCEGQIGDVGGQLSKEQRETIEPRERRCAVCGQKATKVCAACKGVYLPEEYTRHTGPREKGLGIAYCGRECQRIDWRRHRKSCKRVTITVRMMSGEEKILRELPIETNLLEIAGKISAWVYSRQSEDVKQEYDEKDIEIDLLYKGRKLQNWYVTIDELGMKEQEELSVVVKILQMPELVDTSEGES